VLAGRSPQTKAGAERRSAKSNCPVRLSSNIVYYRSPGMLILTLFIQIAIVVCIVMYTSIYLHGITRGTVKPVLATWLFFSVATVLSFITNFSESGVQGVLENSYNIVDTLASLLIFIVVLFTKGLRKSFTVFEAVCVGAVILIFVTWLLSGQNILAHLCLQVILVIAYLPTLVHLWNARESSEPPTTWSLNALAAVFGIIEPIRSHDFLPLIYGIRSIISCLAVILLIVRQRIRRSQAVRSSLL